MTESLIPPLTTKALEEMAEKTNSNELNEVERRDQWEEEKDMVYQRTHVGQLSEEESNME